jgi:hypothetical protein
MSSMDYIAKAISFMEQPIPLSCDLVLQKIQHNSAHLRHRGGDLHKELGCFSGVNLWLSSQHVLLILHEKPSGSNQLYNDDMLALGVFALLEQRPIKYDQVSRTVLVPFIHASVA